MESVAVQRRFCTLKELQFTAAVGTLFYYIVSHNPCFGNAGMVEFEGEEYLVEPDPDVEDLVDSMSAAFYSLAATGTVRVGRLCKSPQLLACWALELLEEQACNVSYKTSVACKLCSMSLLACCPNHNRLQSDIYILFVTFQK